MAEGWEEHGNSPAALLIFITIGVFQFLSRYIDIQRKKETRTPEEVQLRAEIKKLCREASTYSQPSTFAQAAKLQRLAAAKEKELAKIQEAKGKELKSSYDSSKLILMIVKVLTYILLLIWFWRYPVAAMPHRLVQPFGKILSWKAGVSVKDNAVVGIIPWLVLSTRVCKIISRKLLK